MTQPSLFTEPPPVRTGLEKRPTQCDRLLALLEAHRGDWVPLPTVLALGIAQYNARVWELRRAGYAITNRKEMAEDGSVHSWFRLES